MIDGIQFSSLGEFFAMGGYAFNVWSVYVLFAIFLTVNLVLPLRRGKRILREQRHRIETSIETGMETGATGEDQQAAADGAGWEVSIVGDEK